MSINKKIDAARKADPTGTTVLRNTFVKDMNRRFRAIKQDILVSVDKNDCFGLKGQKSRGVDILEAIPPRAFAFRTDQKKVESFMAWLNDQSEKTLLSGEPLLKAFKVPRTTQGGRSPWTDVYIHSGYKKGVGDAYQRLLKDKGFKKAQEGFLNKDAAINAAMNSPIHADRVALLYTRAFNDLQGISNNMSSLVSRSLAESLAEGRSPFQMARILMRRVDDAGFDLSIKDSMGRNWSALRRARVLARTETIRAHAEGALNMYESAGLEGVSVQAEWITAGDDRVCELCEPLQGQVFTIDDARGMLPRHPQCRCTWIPYLPSVQGKRKTK